ncbi:MAG: glycosyltransferase [Chitinophagales bacterium]|nr:glycosyltransferase [Chitinophagales bacterium]
MLLDKKIVVVMPAYNAALTLQRTLVEIPTDLVDEIVLVDDCSTDSTLEVAQSLGLKHIIPHNKNMGYGGNQKTCYL